MITYNKINIHIDCNQYFNDINSLGHKIRLKGIYDCIVCLKRSGFIAGIRLSHLLGLTLFTTSEIKSIPDKWKNILLVDDKTWRGRQFRKYTRELISRNKTATTACLYIEGTERPDIYVKDYGSKVNLFYERGQNVI